MKITHEMEGNNTASVRIECTEREARQIANALAYHSTALEESIVIHTPRINQAYKSCMDLIMKEDEWAKEIFEKVGY